MIGPSPDQKGQPKKRVNYEKPPTQSQSNNSTMIIMTGTNNDKIDNSTTFSTSSSLHISPLRLHQMLFDAEKDCLATVVSWLPHRQSFQVNDKEQFVNQISKCRINDEWFFMIILH
jgi:hypothetical protein